MPRAATARAMSRNGALEEWMRSVAMSSARMPGSSAFSAGAWPTWSSTELKERPSKSAESYPWPEAVEKKLVR
jgi:hypothetical protein